MKGGKKTSFGEEVKRDDRNKKEQVRRLNELDGFR